ncbi:hypothetical protein D5F01_LYC08891 [Larimichthys crocea]|uniref:Uncharacterized protein n=1 Tax=Larimichthys crocea TaxID=215358 RepID=A0A6G0IJM9_LARCR|nr:hypothetical protein D5F01_LYC08891 [Larimichthys crocea]
MNRLYGRGFVPGTSATAHRADMNETVHREALLLAGAESQQGNHNLVNTLAWLGLFLILPGFCVHHLKMRRMMYSGGLGACSGAAAGSDDAGYILVVQPIWVAAPPFNGKKQVHQVLIGAILGLGVHTVCLLSWQAEPQQGRQSKVADGWTAVKGSDVVGLKLTINVSRGRTV